MDFFNERGNFFFNGGRGKGWEKGETIDACMCVSVFFLTNNNTFSLIEKHKRKKNQFFGKYKNCMKDFFNDFFVVVVAEHIKNKLHCSTAAHTHIINSSCYTPQTNRKRHWLLPILFHHKKV